MDLIGEVPQLRPHESKAQIWLALEVPLRPFLHLAVPSFPRLREVHRDGPTVQPGLGVNE